MPRIIAALALPLLLAGCFAQATVEGVGWLRGAHIQKPPVTIGPGDNQPKKSPCACIRHPLAGA